MQSRSPTKSDVPDRVGGVEEQDFQVLGMPPCFEPAKLSWTFPRNSLAEDFHRGSFQEVPIQDFILSGSKENLDQSCTQQSKRADSKFSRTTAPSPSQAALAALETCQGHREESICMNLHHDNVRNIQLSLSFRAHGLTGKGGKEKDILPAAQALSTKICNSS